MTALVDLASVIRSKNAGPFELTLDIIFEDPDTFRRVVDSGVLTPELIARCYGRDVSQVLGFFVFEPALAIKATIVRPVPSGSIGDTDIFGAQQHAPLLEIEIPD